MSPADPVRRLRPLFLSLAALAALPPALAQTQEPPSVVVDYAHDTGVVANAGTQQAVIASFVVQVHGAPWLRLTFQQIDLAGDALAGTGSFLKLTSIADGADQVLDAIGARQWGNTSAYFNGDGVLVELYAEPGTGPNRVRLSAATAGLVPAPEESQCGPTDDRVPSNDPRAARILPVGCTGWLIDDCNRCFLTAGHCSSGTQTLQFNVPPSLSNGSIQHPPPQHQYAVDGASMQSNGGGGTGNDWAYFGCFPNSTTGQTPFASQGASYTLTLPPPFNPNQNIRVTGYGTDSGVANQVQQTHFGPWITYDIGLTLLQYQADTTGGNSGSPVIHEESGVAIGIHTHAGCSTSGSGGNQGTASSHPGLQAALADPRGVCGSPLHPAGELPSTISAGFPTAVTVEYADAIQPGSATLHWRYDGGAYQSAPMTSLGNGIYRGVLPPPACGDAAEYWFSVDTLACGPLTSPPDAPVSAWSALVGDELVAFADDFEADQGWTVTNDPTVTTGTWERAVPLPGTVEDPPTDGDGSGTCYVTQNASGNFDVDGGSTYLVSPALDLSGGGTVEWRYWLGSSGALGPGDGLFVHVAADPAGASWQLVRSYTATATSWRVDSLAVGTDLPASSTVRVRFTCSDVSTGHIVEGGVDGFVARLVTCDSAGTGYCFGDGSGTACPCSNSGSLGHGCDNSQLTGGGQLSAHGVASVSADSVLLRATALVEPGNVVFVQGDQQQAGGAGIVFADGLRCIGGSLVRLGARPVSGGEASLGSGNPGDPSIAAQGQVPAPGATRHYQVWYRDNNPFCTAELNNLTNGVSIVWAP